MMTALFRPARPNRRLLMAAVLVLAFLTELLAILPAAAEERLADEPAPATLEVAAPRLETTLRGSLAVEGDVVTLGDLFLVTDARASIALLRAPAPGHTVAIPARRLQTAALQHGVIWYNTQRLPEVVVTRVSQKVTTAEIKQALTTAFRDQGLGEDIHLRLANRNISLHLPTTEAVEIAVRSLTFDRQNESFEALLNVTGGTHQHAVRVEGRAIPMVQVPVLVRNIPRRSLIEPEDIDMTSVPINRLNGLVVSDMADLIGKEARRTLLPNQLIRTTEVSDPLFVEKGALVTMVYEVPGMSLTDVGKALQSGTEGEVIAIRNPRSEITVRGEIVAPGRVQVDLRSIRVATN